MPHTLRRWEAQGVVPAGGASGSETGGPFIRQPWRVGDLP